MTQLFSKRAKIRHYIVDAMKDNVDVGGRVYINRTSSLTSDNLPALCIEIKDTDIEVEAGSPFLPTEHRRNMNVLFHCIVEFPIGSDDSQDHEDLVDELGNQVESIFENDPRLAIRLPGYDANDNYDGLTYGYIHNSTGTYDASTDTVERVLIQTLDYTIPYNTHAWVDKRRPALLEFGVQIYPAGIGAEIVKTGGNIDLSFDFNTAQSGVLIGSIPAGRRAVFVAVQVLSAFNGGAYVTIGDAGNPARLFSQTDSDMESINQFMTVPEYDYESETEVNLYLFGIPTQGAGNAVVYYY